MLLPSLLIIAGIVLLFTGIGASLFIWLCAAVLLVDAGFWLMFWLRNRHGVAGIGLLFENLLKAGLAIALIFNVNETSRSIVIVFGLLLVIATISKMWYIGRYKALLPPQLIKFSVFGNLALVLIALIFILMPGIILGMLNGMVSLIFIGSGVTLLLLRR